MRYFDLNCGMAYQAVIFDMDGVVIDTKPVIEAFWQSLANKNGFAISPQAMEEYIHGCPIWLTFEKVFPMLTQKDTEAFMENIHKVEANLSYNLVNGVREFLKLLKQAGVAVGLVTSGYERKVSKVFDQQGLHDFFDQIVTADMVVKGKPDPEPFLLAAEKLQVTPGQCVVFEDAISGITGANAAGMFPVGINEPAMDTTLKAVGAHLVIKDFSVVALKNTRAGSQLFINNTEILIF